ncbi:unnamed protein product [Heterobilharzia americana]|nr:unnamed protein product [Heterobilharzia americana]CAH8490128.1 unnamed protein product [Heterobilharzia americana]
MSLVNKRSTMEQFITAFIEMDKDHNEMIDRQELVRYCQQNRMDMKQIDSWISRFDTDKDGKVSLDEFCRGLGLKQSEIRHLRDEMKRAKDGKVPDLPNDIEIIASTMSTSKQHEICSKFKEIAGSTGKTGNEMREVTSKLKSYLDSQHGRVWQVVILTGSYWMNFSHEPFMSIQFKHNNHVCLVWRTPC